MPNSKMLSQICSPLPTYITQNSREPPDRGSHLRGERRHKHVAVGSAEGHLCISNPGESFRTSTLHHARCHGGNKWSNGLFFGCNVRIGYPPGATDAAKAVINLWRLQLHAHALLMPSRILHGAVVILAWQPGALSWQLRL